MPIKHVRLEGTSVWFGDQHLWDFAGGLEMASAHCLAASYIIHMGCFLSMESVRRFLALVVPWYVRKGDHRELSTPLATLLKIEVALRSDAECEEAAAAFERVADAFVDPSTPVAYDKDTRLLHVGESSFGPDTTFFLNGLIMNLFRMAGASEETLECIEDSTYYSWHA